MSAEHFTLPRALTCIRESGWIPGGIVDIGVGAGTAGLYSVWPGTPLCLIEPAPEAMVFMQQVAAKYGNVHIFNYGASDRQGELAGRQQPGLLNVFFGRGQAYEEKVFPVRTCDDMVAEAGLASPLLLKIDTDSHERQVLAGAEATLARAEVCVIENNVFHPLRGMMSPAEIWRFLADRGFAFLDIGDCSIAESGVLRAADFVFARQDSPIFRSAMERSAKSAHKLAKRMRQYRKYAVNNPII